MRKIILLTDHYYPINNAAVNRIAAWVKYFPAFGYKPIVFVRCSDYPENCLDVVDLDKEIYYIDAKSYLQNINPGKFFGKIIRGIEFFFHNSLLINNSGLYIDRVAQYIRGNDVKLMIASGPSFSIFGCASKIKNRTNIKWIADYRDDWSTSELFSGIRGLIIKSQVLFELLYLRNAEAFFSVSHWYVEKISKCIGKRGYLVENGYDLNPVPGAVKSDANILRIVYPGVLYDTQKLEFLMDFINLLRSSFENKIEIIFIGTDKNVVLSYIHLLNDKSSLPFIFLNRLSKIEADNIIKSACYVVYIAHVNGHGELIKGIPSSKLYEYIGLEKKVLMLPSDKDFAEKKLKECGLAIAADSPQELVNDFLADLNCSGYLTVENKKYIDLNRRENTVKFIATILNQYC